MKKFLFFFLIITFVLPLSIQAQKQVGQSIGKKGLAIKCAAYKNRSSSNHRSKPTKS